MSIEDVVLLIRNEKPPRLLKMAISSLPIGGHRFQLKFKRLIGKKTCSTKIEKKINYPLYHPLNGLASK